MYRVGGRKRRINTSTCVALTRIPFSLSDPASPLAIEWGLGISLAMHDTISSAATAPPNMTRFWMPNIFRLCVFGVEWIRLINYENGISHKTERISINRCAHPMHREHGVSVTARNRWARTESIRSVPECDFGRIFYILHSTSQLPRNRKWNMIRFPRDAKYCNMMSNSINLLLNDWLSQARQ